MPLRERVPRFTVDAATFAFAYGTPAWLEGHSHGSLALLIGHLLVALLAAWYVGWWIVSPATVVLAWGPGFRRRQRYREHERDLARLQRWHREHDALEER